MSVLRNIGNRLDLWLDNAVDFIQTQEGRRKLRDASIPFLITGAIIMIAVGSTWASLLSPECGYTYDTAKFSISTDVYSGQRILTGNSCPGYDWSGQKTFTTAGAYNFNYALPTEPRISKYPISVGITNPIAGPIGITINVIPIFNPATSNNQDAIQAQHKLMDKCGGLNAVEKKFAFNAPIPGYYHYLAFPGIHDPLTTTSISKSSQSYCNPSSRWYNESFGRHSPLAGFMADGVPIYGPFGKKGVIPTDLDECGGHSSDDHKFYHYHFQLHYPYSVNCLRGCADGKMNPNIRSGTCTIEETFSYDYSPLLGYSTTYGGSGNNDLNITGPACLITFGVLLLIASSTCCGLVYCRQKSIEERLHAKLPSTQNEEFGYADDDNVL